MMPLLSMAHAGECLCNNFINLRAEPLAVAPAPEQPATAQTEGQAELEAVRPVQEEPTTSGSSGRLAEISEGQLKVLIQQRAAAGRKAAEQAMAQVQEQVQRQCSEQESQQQESVAG